MVSRRDLLARAGRLALLALGGGAPSLLSGCATSSGSAAAASSDPELAPLLDAVIGVDMHSHSGGVHFRSTPSVDLAERLRLGRMTAVCLCHTGDGPVIRRNADNHVVTARNPGPGELWRHTQSRLDFFDGMIRAQGLRRVLKAGDLESAHRDRAPAIVQSIEGSQFLEGRIERVAEVYRRGVRQLQLVHFFRSELGDNQTESPDQGGLTTGASGHRRVQSARHRGRHGSRHAAAGRARRRGLPHAALALAHRGDARGRRRGRGWSPASTP